MEFACEGCGWTGTEPVTDAHLNAFCPTCGRMADFAAFVRERAEKRKKSPA